MKALSQSYRNGEVSIIDVPVGAVGANSVKVRTRASLASIGTEKGVLSLARKNLLGKALERPDLVKQFLEKMRNEGFAEAWRQAMGRLDTPMPLGYSSAGTVLEVGSNVQGLRPGDSVACGGFGYAGHIEVAVVPVSLCAQVPEGVDWESAAFVALGGIALQAVRMASVSMGDRVVLIGLGLLGQIAVQLLRAAGCHIFGTDLDPGKVALAREWGADAAEVCNDDADVAAAIRKWSLDRGADAAIILASGRTNEPLELAAEACRERGRVVVTGVVGMDVPRRPFYEKELELVVSRAWGPGLYDPRYTEQCVDYPLPYARWTAKRNMEEFLSQLGRGAVQVQHLVTHRFPFDRAAEAYSLVLEGKEPYIGVILNYSDAAGASQELRTTTVRPEASRVQGSKSSVGVGLIGAGLFARGTLLPILKRLDGFPLLGVATGTGLSGRHVAGKFNFRYCTTDYQEILSDPQVSLVLILTRHGTHAGLAVQALEAGKHVFVEKPLAVDREQLQGVISAYQRVMKRDREREDCNTPCAGGGRVLMVGFNRRFAPSTVWLANRFPRTDEPLVVTCTVNAGRVPADHWAHDPAEGGGRIIGEVCHFVDLIQFLTGSVPVRVYAETLPARGHKVSDNVLVSMKMLNGATGSITYVSGGDKAYPRERVEVFGGGAVGVVHNFRQATLTRGGRTVRLRHWRGVDRGYRTELEALSSVLRCGGPPPVPFEQYVYTTLATFAIEESLSTGRPIQVDPSIMQHSGGDNSVDNIVGSV